MMIEWREWRRVILIETITEMDPHYSVLVGDKDKGECDLGVTEKDGKDNLLPVYIVVPVVGAAFLIAAFAVFKSRFLSLLSSLLSSFLSFSFFFSFSLLLLLSSLLFCWLIVLQGTKVVESKKANSYFKRGIWPH